MHTEIGYDVACHYLADSELNFEKIEPALLEGLMSYLPRLLLETDLELYRNTCQFLLAIDKQLPENMLPVLYEILFKELEQLEFSIEKNNVLDKLQVPESVSVLIKMCEHSALNIQKQAIQQLGKTHIHITSMLMAQPNLALRRDIEQLLQNLPVRASIPVLRKIFLDSNREPSIRNAAAHSLGKLLAYGAGWDLINALTNSDNLLVRQGAINALGDLTLPESIPSLLEVLHDPSEQVRGLAIMALAEFKQKSQWIAEFKVAVHDPIPEIGYHAAQTLYFIDSTRFMFGMNGFDDWALVDRLDTPDWAEKCQDFKARFMFVNGGDDL